MGVFIEEVK